MRTIWKRAKPKEDKRFQVNDKIRVPKVFLIDENNEMIGEMDTAKALLMAQAAELDLVEVNPKAKPPVVKIMDFGQFKYEKEKLAHKQKLQQKKVETKGVRLSMRISSNDLNFRLEQAKKFLEKGDKVKIEMILKGRERQHIPKAVDIINDFVRKLEEKEGINIIREQSLTKQGGRFTIVLANKK